MNIFTANQVNQVYVGNGTVKTDVSALTDDGDILVKADSTGDAIYFQHKGKGGITRSDLINVRNIMYGKVTKAADMAQALKKAIVTFNPDIEDSPIAGEDYVLRLQFSNYVGISPEDSQYWKYGTVHVFKGMTASRFWAEMALSLAKNMSREAVKLVKIQLQGDSANTDITVNTPRTTFINADGTTVGEYTGIVLTEVEPDWVLGLKQQKVIHFEAVPTGINVLEDSEYQETTWGAVTYEDSDEVIKNGKLMADYEYFYHGERGDQYRMVGFPDYVPTSYMVDPSKEYDTVALHYAYVGPNESCQKSEKDITLVVPAGTANTYAEKINSLISNSGITLSVE